MHGLSTKVCKHTQKSISEWGCSEWQGDMVERGYTFHCMCIYFLFKNKFQSILKMHPQHTFNLSHV